LDFRKCYFATDFIECLHGSHTTGGPQESNDRFGTTEEEVPLRKDSFQHASAASFELPNLCQQLVSSKVEDFR
jgi:hypothetical protein